MGEGKGVSHRVGRGSVLQALEFPELHVPPCVGEGEAGYHQLGAVRRIWALGSIFRIWGLGLGMSKFGTREMGPKAAPGSLISGSTRVMQVLTQISKYKLPLSFCLL